MSTAVWRSLVTRNVKENRQARGVFLIALLATASCGENHQNHISRENHDYHGNAQFEWIVDSTDGAVMVSGGAPRVRVLDAKTGKVVHSIDAFARDPVVSDDGKLVLVNGPSTGPISADVIETANGDIVGSIPNVRAIAMRVLGFSEGSRELVVAKDDLISIWDFRTEQLVDTMKVDVPAAPNNHWGYTRSADGRYFAIFVQQTLNSSQPFLLNVEQRSLQSLPFEGKWVTGFAFSTDGTTLAIGGSRDIELHNLHSGEVFHTEPCQNERNQNLNPKRFSPDGAILVAEGDRGQVCVFDTRGGHLLGSGNSAVRSGYDRIDVSLDASRVAIQRSNDHFEIWSTVPAAHIIDIIPDHVSGGGRETRPHGFTPDGSLLLIADRWGVGAWDTKTAKKRYVISDPTTP